MVLALFPSHEACQSGMRLIHGDVCYGERRRAKAARHFLPLSLRGGEADEAISVSVRHLTGIASSLCSSQ
jgi:hypothetical protein